MSQLFTETAGQGTPLLVLHGWGMNRLVWEPVRAALEQQARVTWVDLPGHGANRDLQLGSLQQAVAQLMPLVPEGR
ncbi:MAG: hypothetical protein R3E89_10730 [Thiolinea sp.]